MFKPTFREMQEGSKTYQIRLLEFNCPRNFFFFKSSDIIAIQPFSNSCFRLVNGTAQTKRKHSLFEAHSCMTRILYQYDYFSIGSRRLTAEIAKGDLFLSCTNVFVTISRVFVLEAQRNKVNPGKLYRLFYFER